MGIGAFPFLILLVGSLISLQRHPRAQVLFQWLPVPLWCYLIPALFVQLNWLSPKDPVFAAITQWLLPFALAILLLGSDLGALRRCGPAVLAAAVSGSAGIFLGTVFSVWLLQGALHQEAWKAAGALTGTWTGGTMNLLALRTILSIPEELFGSLILVDALVAYAWMALLVSGFSFQRKINAWLKAAQIQMDSPSTPTPTLSRSCSALLYCCLLAGGIVTGMGWIVRQFPLPTTFASSAGWTLLGVTTVGIALASHPAIRKISAHGQPVGTFCLYLVLAAAGVQAKLEALWSSPIWVLVGLLTLLVHGTLLMVTGRWLRIPMGLLATASQANIGGLVSAPLVAAVYYRGLVPLGLLLAIAGNALGTYAGLLAAAACRWLLR